MNLPNKITLARIILIPFFVASMLQVNLLGEYGKYLTLALFIIASLSDALDGYLARKYKLVTNFGKLMDPLADKLLVSSALLCLTYLQRLPVIVVILIISREFIISGFRQIAADNGVVIAASIWGKFKTAVQMIMVCLLIIDLRSLGNVIVYLENLLIILALLLTILSLLEYLWKNRHIITRSM